MEFKDKQYDGKFEVFEIEIHNQGERIRGILYFPPNKFLKPYPLIIYFHEFPQLLSFQNIIRDYKYLLEMGYAFLMFNFRGYRLSEGEISLRSQVSDGLSVCEFVSKMADKNIFDLDDINIIANDLGAYIALLLTHKIDLINRLLLISPIIDLEKHVFQEDFKRVLEYIKKFLPTSIRGTNDIQEFIKSTKEELSEKHLNLNQVAEKLQYKKLKIIMGEDDKITPLKEVNFLVKNQHKDLILIVIKDMDHEPFEDNEFEKIKSEIKLFFSR
ncbi:MAG: alpha/beta hydrolase family protein [Promethearchaeati archaeon]